MDTAPSDKKFILIGEDNKLIARVLSNKLQQAGYDVTVASDGQEVLQSIAVRKPDLLLIDLIMPNKDGFTTLAELHANPDTKDIKVIVTSDLQQPEDIARVQQFGVLNFFDKANLQHIVEEVTHIL